MLTCDLTVETSRELFTIYNIASKKIVNSYHQIIKISKLYFIFA